MKLIKINTDHYVIVDGFATDGFFYHKGSIKKYNSGSLPSDCKKITHSTKVAIEDYWNVIELPLSEVKELIGEIDVEKKAHNWSTRQTTRSTDYWRSMVSTYVEAYTQALEDNKEKKYTEEDMKYMFECGRNYQNNAEITFKVSMEYLQQSKTEWEVEFVEGKLKIK